MFSLLHIRIFLGLLLLATTVAVAQDDETRQASGLPSKIGENVARGGAMNVSGRISLESNERLTRRPVIKVTVLHNGTPADSAVANDAGIYLVRNVPRDGATILVEVDGAEIIRQPILASAMGNPRVDYSIPWPTTGTTVKPAVISTTSAYSRSEKNELLFQKALAVEKSGDMKSAINVFNEILSADTKDFEAWTEVGTIYFKSGAFDNAEAGYFKAIELKKDFFPALLNLGKLYVQRQQFDNAILVLNSAVASSPRSLDAHRLLGESYLQTKKGSLAVQQFNEAIKLAPMEMAELHLRLAALYDAAGARDRAAAEYKAFLQKRPDYSDRSKLEEYIKANPAH